MTSSYRGRSIPPFGGGVLIGQRQDSKPSTSRRSNAVPPKWRLTCPYCGMSRGVSPVPDAWSAAVVEAVCEFTANAIDADADGEHVIDMDQVADQVARTNERPSFY